MITVGSLCSGYGGLELGLAEVLPIRTVWHCENDPHSSKVLAHHWPGVLNHGDLTATDWTSVEPVDVVCAGFLPADPQVVVDPQRQVEVEGYAGFLAGKARRYRGDGIDVDPDDLHPSLFPFQRDLTVWALRKGRAALFAGTGLGKTRCQVEWARCIVERSGGHALILAPLAVAPQTIAEAAVLGVDVAYVRNDADADRAAARGCRLVITNYERLHLLTPRRFAAVVLDESSILKAFSGVVKRQLVAAFRGTRYKLACTATPAPNDVEELCNHADLLEVMSSAEMRSTFFIAANRGEFMRYRLKGHAEQAFYRWLASWAMAIRKPSDLGYDDAGFELPPLNIREHTVASGWTPDDRLFADQLRGVTERAQVRRATVDARVAAALEIVRGERDQQWLVWCGTNAEQYAMAAGLEDAVSIDGRTPHDDRVDLEAAWRTGAARVLVTKAQVFGWGMNWQHCARMVFVGINDSFESWHQALRRCWRYGQSRPVEAHVVLSDVERHVYANVLAKQHRHDELAAGLLAGVVGHERAELFAGTSKGDSYEPRETAALPAWLVAS